MRRAGRPCAAPAMAPGGIGPSCPCMTPRDTEPLPTTEPAAAMSPAALRAAFFRTFPAVAPSILLGAIDQTIVATALPAIAGSLGVVEGLSWVVVAYLVAATVAAPVYGRLGDVFGRKRLLLAALGVNAVGTVVALLAPSFGWLILGRLLQGAGGGGLTTLTMALIGVAVPPRERGRFQAWIAACFTSASCLGPLAGGWLTGAFGWRAVFGAMLPVVALAWVLALRLPRRPVDSHQAAWRFDLPGVLLFAAFVGPALLALGQAQRLSLAALPMAAALAVSAALALWLLLRWERRVRHPLLPLGLLAEPAILRSNLFTACAHGGLVALVSFLPIYLQSARGLTPGQAGVMLLPLSLGGGLGALSAGQLITRTGLAAPLAAGGLAVSAAGLATIALLAPALPDAGLALLFGVVALGIGCSYPVSQITVQVAAGSARLGAGAASVQYFRTLGAAVATAMLGALLFGTLAAGDAGVAALFARAMQDRAAGAGLTAAEAAALRGGLVEAFRLAFLGVAVLVGAGGVVAWRVPVRRV